MTGEQFINFVHTFNQVSCVTLETIEQGLSKLPQKDHELFMLLVNYKNGNDFLKKLKEGKI